MARYPPSLHKEAYELWKRGWSLVKISQLPHMPSRRTLHEWAGPFSKCRCGYHNWHKLYQQEQAEAFQDELQEVKEKVQQAGPPAPADIENALSMLKETLESRKADLGPAQDALVLALSMLAEEGVDYNEVITGDLHMDMNALAYAMIVRAIEAIRRVEIRDVYHVVQVIRAAIAILNMFRPALPEPEEIEQEIEYDVSFGTPLTEKPWLEGEGAADEESKEEMKEEIRVGHELFRVLPGEDNAEGEDDNQG